jgi:hypothetical protein
MKWYGPLDAQKWMANIDLGVPQNISIINREQI